MTKISINIIISITLLFGCSGGESRKTDDAATSIINAIEKYKGDTHHYPPSLKQLMPEYLPEIPTTAYHIKNNQFFYERVSASDSSQAYFELCFFAPLGVEVRYNSLKREWTHDD